jgi:membrane-associated protease RseP (regulator of RpoE activity)
VDTVARTLAAHIARLRADPSTAAFASKLRVSRAGDTQVVVHLDDAAGVDLAAAARTVVGWAEQPAPPGAASFTCPAPVAAPGPSGAFGAAGAPADLACTDGTHFRTRSLRAAVSLIATGQPSAVVANGAVVGLRLARPVAALGLVAGDVIVAIDGRLVMSRAMFLHLLAGARTETRVTVRRRGTEKVLHFVER